jgi:dCMP deaminase
MLIISVGITKVVVKRKYHAAGESRELLQQAEIPLIVLENNYETYDNQ